MARDWTCYVCKGAVSWGTAICPLCGSALSWEEEDEEQPSAALMPPTWDGDDTTARKRRVRRYALAAIGFGLLVTALSLASGVVRLSLLFLGVLFVAGGVYGLVTLPNRYL
jgi:hypothetical protein